MYYCLILYSYTHCTFQQIDVQAICSNVHLTSTIRQIVEWKLDITLSKQNG